MSTISINKHVKSLYRYLQLGTTNKSYPAYKYINLKPEYAESTNAHSVHAIQQVCGDEGPVNITKLTDNTMEYEHVECVYPDIHSTINRINAEKIVSFGINTKLLRNALTGLDELSQIVVYKDYIEVLGWIDNTPVYALIMRLDDERWDEHPRWHPYRRNIENMES